MIKKHHSSHIRPQKVSRRDFLKIAAATCLLTGCRPAQQSGGVPSVEPASTPVSTDLPTDVSTPASESTDQSAGVGAGEQDSEGLTISSPSAEGIDPDEIAELIERIRDGIYGSVHSMLIVKGGKLVVEEYFDGYAYELAEGDARGPFIDYGPDTLHDMASVSKSITSALVGIAIDQGFIQSVNEKLFTFFPEYAHLNDDEKDQITLEHLLTMTSGLEWTQSGRGSDTEQIFAVDNPIEYILSRPMAYNPGTRFDYHQGNPILLGEVIKKATGLRVDDFAEEYLFAPLGVTQHEWVRLHNNVIYTPGDLRLCPRAMAKFGLLFLQGGEWNGRTIISREWIEESTQGRLRAYYGMYGYLWWIITFVEATAYAALGRGGQGIFIYPDLDMVVVFTGGSYAPDETGNEPYPPLSILRNRFLPSVTNQ